MKQLNWYQIFGNTKKIPDGRTVLPTDDIQILLNCANIWDKAYTTIAQLLADTTSLMTVISDNNAIDYLVRSTTFASSVTADSSAMSLIGANDYAAETLLSDATWCAAVGNSEYRESVLNIKVPKMVSATAPSGKVTAKTQAYGAAWQAFDKNPTTVWNSDYNVVGQWIDYEFPESVDIIMILTTNINNVNFCPRTAKYKVSEDGVTYSEVCSMNQDIIAGATFVTIPSSPASGNHHRIELTAGYDNAGRAGYAEVQFYGRENGGVQTWLHAAGITDKLYTTLSEVLADSTTLTALMSSHSAVDYLVTAKGWADDICADSGAMTAIGNNNYAADTLLADATWSEAICNSTYWQSVLNAKNPDMTSNTAPSGVASANGNYTDYYPWKALDGNDNTSWASPSTASLSDWLKYEFADDGIIIKKIRIKSSRYQTYKIQASNDNANWTDLYSGVTGDVSAYIENTTRYKYIKYVPTSLVGGANSGSISEFKVYGREDV